MEINKRMELTDVLAVLSVFGLFAYLILARVEKNNPGFIDKVKIWLSKKKEEKPKIADAMHQVYVEKRELI